MNTQSNKSTSHWPLAALSCISSILGVLLPLILVRIVTPGEVGTFKIFFLYLGIIPALSLSSGLRSGLAYWSGQKAKSTDAVAVSSSLVLILAAGSAALIFAFQNDIIKKFNVTSTEVFLFAISLVGAVGGPYFEEAAIAVGKVWTGALFYCGSELIRTIAIVTSLLFYRSLTAVLIAHTAVSTCKVIAGYLYGYRLGLVGLSLKPGIARDVLRYALPVSLAYIFAIFIGSSDQVLLATRISPSEFALYSMGCLSIAPLLSFEQSVTRVLIPRMSHALSTKNPQRAAVLYQSAVDNLAFILIPATSGLIIFASPVVDLFFTARYAAAATYLQFFALSYLLLVIPHDALARARGESGWILRTFIIFATISFVLSYTLIPVAGPIGALSGILLAGALMRAYSVNHFKGALELKLPEFLPLRTLAIYTILSLLLAKIAVLTHPHFDSERAWFFGSGSLFLLSYLCLALPIKNRGERRRHGHRGVLILTQSLQVGGIERMILHLSRFLQAEGRWQMHVLAYDHASNKTELLELFRDAHVPVEAFQKRSGFSPRVVYRILRSTYQNDISIIHSNDLGTLIYAVISKICSCGRLSVVHTQHSFPAREEHLKYRIYRLLFSMGIDQLAVVSDDVEESYKRFRLNLNKTQQIANGVEFADSPIARRDSKLALRRTYLTKLPDNLRDHLDGLIDKVWIAYQARFSPGKGQDTALRLWKELTPEVRTQTVLCLIGTESVNGEHERIRAIIRECPDYSQIVVVEGSIDPLAWLRMSDLFLSCSAYEGMPLAPLEAAGSGLPLVLSAIPGHAFLSHISFQFPLTNARLGAARLEDALSRLQHGGENYQIELWQNSKEIRDRFSIKEMAGHYSRLYTATMF